MQKAVIVLPTYNEAKNVEEVLHLIFAQQSKVPSWELHVVVVDSASPDGTGPIVERLSQSTYPRLHLIKSKKEGLGKAYLTGFEIAIQKLSPDVLFEMDADLSHDPASARATQKGVLSRVTGDSTARYILLVRIL